MCKKINGATQFNIGWWTLSERRYSVLCPFRIVIKTYFSRSGWPWEVTPWLSIKAFLFLRRCNKKCAILLFQIRLCCPLYDYIFKDKWDSIILVIPPEDFLLCSQRMPVWKMQIFSQRLFLPTHRIVMSGCPVSNPDWHLLPHLIRSHTYLMWKLVRCSPI